MIFMKWFGSSQCVDDCHGSVCRTFAIWKVGSSSPGNDEPKSLNKNKRQVITVSQPSSWQRIWIQLFLGHGSQNKQISQNTLGVAR